MADFEFFLQVVIETFTLFILLAGLLGLLIPVAGPTVMWFSTLFYAIAQSLKDNMTGGGLAALCVDYPAYDRRYYRQYHHCQACA